MEIPNENSRRSINGLIEILNDIHRKDYQKRVWIYGEGPEVDSFEDAVCDFFHRCDSVLKNYKEFGITEDQYRLLKNFRDEFDRFCDDDDNYWPQDFIDTPEWTRITKMAGEVLIAFGYKIEGNSST